MAAAPAHDYLIKLMFVGNGMTGKSSLLLRYADDVFTQSYIATIGIDFKVKNIEFNEKRVKLQMWDTSGQERFRQITRTYFRGTKGAIFVYDITNENSFKQIGQWINDFKEGKIKELARGGAQTGQFLMQ
ncbi:uncharacterized protein [Dysidea avara]|uniref:uncharacterized protein isoform X3 n=1 Tax=Dysidea avara TaxID=196820 RepID=UPI00332F61EA